MKICLLALLQLLAAAALFGQMPHLSSGTLRRFEQFASKYVDPRTVDVWLPDGYPSAGKYAVLYMQDGQSLFDSAITWNHQEWGVDETIGALLRDKKIQPCIVVGIWNDGGYRHAEYFPQKAITYMNDSARRELMPLLKNDPRGDRYLKFLVRELKPFIDSSFATLQDPAHTFIMGSSMGGLISLYAICEYPELFSGAACLSTHWTGIFRKENNTIPSAILAYLRDHLPDPGHHRIYFDHGTQTLDSMYGDFQLAVDSAMHAAGYTAKNEKSLVFGGADHSENAWRKRLQIPVIFLLGLSP